MTSSLLQIHRFSEQPTEDQDCFTMYGFGCNPTTYPTASRENKMARPFSNPTPAIDIELDFPEFSPLGRNFSFATVFLQMIHDNMPTITVTR